MLGLSRPVLRAAVRKVPAIFTVPRDEEARRKGEEET